MEGPRAIGGPAGQLSTPAGARRAAEQFEAIFIRLLLDKMLPEESGLFGSGAGAGIVRGMFVDQVGAGLAGRRSLGIADVVERSLMAGGAVRA